jgi:hypothetical protein
MFWPVATISRCQDTTFQWIELWSLPSFASHKVELFLSH